MQKDNSTCLEGPILGSKAWWREFGRDEEIAAESFDQPDSAPIRRDLVNRIRREIAEGTYDTPAKWAMALDQLARTLGD